MDTVIQCKAQRVHHSAPRSAQFNIVNVVYMFFVWFFKYENTCNDINMKMGKADWNSSEYSLLNTVNFKIFRSVTYHTCMPQ